MSQLANQLDLPAAEAARRLLGCELIRKFEDGVARVRIVETEAYDESDTASHSYKGRTRRTEVMFGPAGFLYVYFTYGMHYCCNVVVGKTGEGAAVLIRAVEPLDGVSVLFKRRPNHLGAAVTNGPAKLCQALAINHKMNGHDLTQAPLQLRLAMPRADSDISVSTRIGIRLAKDVPWRFTLTGNQYLSR